MSFRVYQVEDERSQQTFAMKVIASQSNNTSGTDAEARARKKKQKLVQL